MNTGRKQVQANYWVLMRYLTENCLWIQEKMLETHIVAEKAILLAKRNSAHATLRTQK